jgi:hypothetical protein
MYSIVLLLSRCRESATPYGLAHQLGRFSKTSFATGSAVKTLGQPA